MTTKFIKVFIISMLLIGLISVAKISKAPQKIPKISVNSEIPLEIDKWTGENLPIDDSVFSRILPNEIIVRNYKAKDEKDAIYTAVVVSDDRTHIHDPEICYKLQGFKFISKKKLMLNSSSPISVLEAINQNKKYSFVYWYTNMNKKFDNRIDFFIDYSWKKFMNNPVKSSGIVIIYTEKDNYQNLIKFSKKMQVTIDRIT